MRGQVGSICLILSSIINEGTWIGKASISALRATKGGEPDPMVATTPVRATGHRYVTPSCSSSRLMSALVLNSSYASSGCSWISLLTFFIQSTVLGSLANPIILSLAEEFWWGVWELAQYSWPGVWEFKEKLWGMAMEIRNMSGRKSMLA